MAFLSIWLNKIWGAVALHVFPNDVVSDFRLDEGGGTPDP
jgi:hypothetical protein